MAASKVYVVGTPEGAKVNQYEAMTNSLKEAERLAQEIGQGAVIKPVDVRARK